VLGLLHAYEGGIMQDKNRLVIDGCTGSYTLSENEQLTAALLNDLICEAQTANLLNLDLLMDVMRVNSERAVVEVHAQFTWAGTLSRGTPQQVTYAIFRRSFRTTGDMNFAVVLPKLEPTEFEKNAVAYSQVSCPALSSERIAYFNSIGKQPDAPEKPDPIIENLKKEIAAMERDL
jgi:hypothetical protein